jgi:hypothetical protein
MRILISGTISLDINVSLDSLEAYYQTILIHYRLEK